MKRIFERMNQLLFLFVMLGMSSAGLNGCALLVTRPSQEMYNMGVAIRAAKEVGADTLAPELFRMASEKGLEARREFRVKNFKEAKELAEKSRIYAERAEFESIKNGGKREVLPADPLSEPSYAPEEIQPASPDEEKKPAAPETKPTGSS